MKAILFESPCEAEKLYIGEAPPPELKEKEILVKVKAFAVNRADTLQRIGKYPAPTGASQILGLEFAGIVENPGQSKLWKKGDKVFGLVSGGAYAEYVAIHEEMAVVLPKNLSFVEAAAIPEVFLTAWQALCWLAVVRENETAIIHTGGSGVGTAAIQICKELNVLPIITASKEKHDTCESLGAKLCIDYKTQSFSEEVKRFTSGKGVNTIIDFLGASYFEDNISSLSIEGRLVILAFMGGAKVNNVNLANLLFKRISIHVSSLRSRSLDYQIKLNKDFFSWGLSRFKSTQLLPVVYEVLDWKNTGKAHKIMEENANTGKIVLEVS